MRILLVSTYELGHQPLGLAAPAAVLRARGHEVECLDLSVVSPEVEPFRRAELIGFSVPMHTATRIAIALARDVRRVNPHAHLVFYGLYASPLYEHLTASGVADSVIGGEYESPLAELADRLSSRASPHLGIDGLGPKPTFERRTYPVPDRSGLPALEHYAQASTGTEMRLAGYVEASRGCAHRCRHCPLTPVYDGRLRLVQKEVVLADCEQLIDLGAGHITFGDPDFFNAVPHSLAIVEELHRRHPELTFDATIKVEHLLQHARLLPRLRQLGCIFVTSAFESTDDAVLQRLEKGHTRADLDTALSLTSAADIALHPTWVAFTPWTTAEAYLDMLAFIEDHGLANHLQPVQMALRLLLPPGSPLVDVLRMEGALGPFDEAGLTYTWRNPDPRLDELQAEAARIVEDAASREYTDWSEPYEATFLSVKRAALRLLRGHEGEVTLKPQPWRPIPGLSEDWFC